MSMEMNKAWNLEEFLNSLTYELDKARETLAIKGVSRPLTYAVKDMSMELQLFPEYDGEQVRFTTAKPNENGASKIAIQLGSITDRQIRETSKTVEKDDIDIDVIEEIDEDTKSSLKKIGINSLHDLEQLEKKNIPVEHIAKKVAHKNKGEAIESLADKLKRLRGKKEVMSFQRALQEKREAELKPVLEGLQLKKSGEHYLLSLSGKNLAIDPFHKPQAICNGQSLDVVAATEDKVILQMTESLLKKKDEKNVYIQLDENYNLKFNLK